MTNNLNVKATKAVDDSRMVSEAVYPGATSTARNVHNIVATSIHQVKDADVAARKVADEVKTDARKDASVDVKVTSRDMHKDAGMKARKVADEVKTDARKDASVDAKVTSHGMHKDAGMKAPSVSGDAKSGVHKAGEGA